MSLGDKNRVKMKTLNLLVGIGSPAALISPCKNYHICYNWTIFRRNVFACASWGHQDIQRGNHTVNQRMPLQICQSFARVVTLAAPLGLHLFLQKFFLAACARLCQCAFPCFEFVCSWLFRSATRFWDSWMQRVMQLEKYCWKVKVSNICTRPDFPKLSLLP